jgi:hypothetical protein
VIFLGAIAENEWARRFDREPYLATPKQANLEVARSRERVAAEAAAA